MTQDWKLLTDFFPVKWQELAIQTEAIKGLRKNKPIGDLLRVILIHIACGCSLRENSSQSTKS